MLNQVILCGRLLEEVKVIELEDKKYATFTLIVLRAYKDMDGEYKNDLIPIIAYGPMISNIVEYCHKGDLVGIKGRIEAKDNTIEIIAEKISFLSNNKETK